MSDLDMAMAELKPETAARFRRLLVHRGTLRAFAISEGLHRQGLSYLMRMVARKGGPLLEAMELSEAMRDGLRPQDLVPCTRCHLRGHVAGDPDRCLHRGSLGLGGEQCERALKVKAR